MVYSTNETAMPLARMFFSSEAVTEKVIALISIVNMACLLGDKSLGRRNGPGRDLIAPSGWIEMNVYSTQILMMETSPIKSADAGRAITTTLVVNVDSSLGALALAAAEIFFSDFISDALMVVSFRDGSPRRRLNTKIPLRI